MHKIDSYGATVLNEFTEGNAALAVPATRVSANWANAVQKELVAIATGSGASLKTSGTETGTQALEAILELIKRGGLSAPVAATLANNTSNADVTGFPTWLSTQVLCVTFLYRILRRTDSSHVLESGRMYISWDSETSAWVVTKVSVHDDAGVIFSVVTTGVANTYKLQYTSDNIAGASYVGTVRITDIKTIMA